MTFLEKNGSAGYVNSSTADQFAVFQEPSSGPWRIAVHGETIKGDYSSQVDAHEAARLLCQGVDPTTITGA